MTNNKEDGSVDSSSKDSSNSCKKTRPKYTSQLSNISFSSITGGHSTTRSSGGNSPISVARRYNPLSLPRMSLRSLLMNSPFSKRNKLRKGCSTNKSSKSSNYEGAGSYFLSITDDKVDLQTSAKLSSNIHHQNSTSLQSSSTDSKAQSSLTDPSKWGSNTENEQFAPIHTASNDSLPDSLKHGTSSRAASDTASTTSSSKLKDCPLCLQILDPTKFPELLTCSHTACLSCMKQYLIVEITESRVNISCPQCHQLMHPTDIHQILNNSILSFKYEDFMMRRVLAMDPDTRWCPAPDCGYAVIASGCASCPKLKCERPGCESYFCYHCKAEWHPNQTCDMARAQRFPNVPFSSISHLQDIQNSDDVKSCPRCQVLIVKMDDGSCNHMTCSLCSAEFCWLCMKEISDLHYLSPSGCTFWGKKPWSRKKVIMWQLGTLVGAPVGIALLAGIAVPAMIIGIPIWVGRKLHSRCSSFGKHKRNLAVVCGVTASALLSPVTAGLAVSIGIPILLAYVYGVVPISLCRSGGCGVTTSATGVRFAFDDENDVVIGIPGRHSEPNPSLGANPSIGEVSCGASLSAESAGHLLSESDRESASNAAIAPASLTGSIASSCLSRSHRLEMRSDVLHGNRSMASVDTQSSAASMHNIDMENASTKALAGSLLHYKLTESECENSSLSGAVSRTFGGGDSVSRVMEEGAASSGHHLHGHYSNHSGVDNASTDACSVHSGIDVMRLDSVSAIIKAAKVHPTFPDTDDDEISENRAFPPSQTRIPSRTDSVVLEIEDDSEQQGSTDVQHSDQSIRGLLSVRPKEPRPTNLQRTPSLASSRTGSQDPV